MTPSQPDSLHVIDAVAWALTHPTELKSWSAKQWEVLLPMARRANLLARLAQAVHLNGITPHLDERVQAHLIAERTLAAAQQRDVVREVDHVLDALHEVGIEPVLLKGAAYVVTQSPAAQGRLFADVDILVDRRELPQAEAALMLAGWATSHPDPYDQRYYRQWMHELPPMVHIHRHTTLDVHHAISPRMARQAHATQKLLEASIQVPFKQRSVRVLCKHDQVLHSLIHLFQNEDMTHALRDLSDMDVLLREAGKSEGFWDGLQHRAHELSAWPVLKLGLRHVNRLFGTPMPQAFGSGAASLAFRDRWMDAVWTRVLCTPQARDQRAFAYTASSNLVFVRAHWQRMPTWMLGKHLVNKSYRSIAEAWMGKDKTPT